MVGELALCTKGILGFIQREKDGVYHGINVRTLKPWQSTDPMVIAPTGRQSILDCLRFRIQQADD